MSSARRLIILSLAMAALISVLFHQAAIGSARTIDLTPTSTLDRLATPVMPASPTSIDIGRMVYYINCMPCHGDKGQGLTDEWRAVWVEDHQDCWARGCHGGRRDDEGFPLSRTVPPVIGTGLARFQTVDALVDFLHQTQPPQHPGRLTNDDYQAVALFLLHENGRAVEATDRVDATGLIALGVGGLIVFGLGLAWLKRRSGRAAPR
jgi:mono/diheme cytochrome c family protein